MDSIESPHPELGSNVEAKASSPITNNVYSCLNDNDSDQDEYTIEAEQNEMWDHLASLLLQNLDHNSSNSSSDYAYVQSLSFTSSRQVEPLYFYPTNIPPGLVFVDSTGWLPAGECVRFLMMGYRVWNEEGRRMHFAGEAVAYDSLEFPFRSDAKYICLQPEDEIPDLHSQIEVGDLYQNPPSEDAKLMGMPWNCTRRVPPYIKENVSFLTQVRIAWNTSRFETSKPCYTLPQPGSYEIQGGWKMLSPPLIEISTTSLANLPPGPYPKVGIDFECLHIQYPPSRARIDYEECPRGPGEDSLCDICISLDFRDIFEWGLVDLEIDLGTTEELLSRLSCNFCRVLAQLCLDGLEFLQRIRHAKFDCPTRSREPKFVDGQPINATLIRNPALCLSTKPHLVLCQSYHREYLGPIISMGTVRGDLVGNCSAKVTRHVGFAALLDTIENCDSHHGPLCGKHTGFTPGDIFSAKDESIPILLFNVKKMCLETADASSARYAALSYVWGQKPMLQTLRENVQNFKKPHSINHAVLSQLVKDVIVVVNGLHLEYLWIDALCIVQDDAEQKQAQIGRMADIYGRAYLTIVALSSTSTDSPLPGISEPLPQLIDEVDGMLFTSRLSPLAWNAHNRVYEQRGWTFQERLVSRRCLFFSERQVYFECGQISTSDHERNFPLNDQGRLDYPFNPLKKVWKTLRKNQEESGVLKDAFSLQTLDLFCQLVAQYTSRNLTHQSDIENAFLALQDTTSSTLGWTFVGGIPIEIFDWALLWLPLGRLQRRSWMSTQNDGTGELCTVEQHPPSWSWLGWEGQVSYACYTYHGKPFLQNIRPRISSYTIKGHSIEVEIRRKPSAIWQGDFQAEIQTEQSFENVTRCQVTGSSIPPKSTLPLLLETSTVLLFEADTMPALVNPFDKIAKGDDDVPPKQLDKWMDIQRPERRQSRSNDDLTSYDGKNWQDRKWPWKPARSLSRARTLSMTRSRSSSQSSHSSQRNSSELGPVHRVQSVDSFSTTWTLEFDNRDSVWSEMRSWGRNLSRENVADVTETNSMRDFESRGRSPERLGTAKPKPSVGSKSTDVSNDLSRQQQQQQQHSSDMRTFPFAIEWLNTGASYGMLRHGLRHGYNYTILELAQAQDEPRLDLVAMVDCDVHQTFRGGQFGEEKAFTKKDQVVVMLVLWDEDFKMAERIAIGSAAKSEWEALALKGNVSTRKTVRLV